MSVHSGLSTQQGHEFIHVYFHVAEDATERSTIQYLVIWHYHLNIRILSN